MTEPVDLVVERLADRGCAPKQNGAGWKARCPAHDDGNPSLGLNEGDDGRALVCCYAGCELRAVLEALGLTEADLFVPKPGNGDGGRQVVATYKYVDEDGNLLFEAVRFHPKDFRQRRPDRLGGWEWKLGDTRRVLYRLPQLITAVAAGLDVFVVEGERDVHSVEAAGCAATCNPMGAGKWRAEYAEPLKGADVIIVADRDKAGYDHARDVSRSLAGAAATVRVVEALVGKDVSDHLAGGHTLEELAVVDLDQADGEEGTATHGPDARLLTGAEFLFGEAPSDDPLVGRDNEVLHASGEATFVIAVTGVGKSTYAQQYLLRRLGLVPGDFLGYPVRPVGEGEAVLYVAADRPRQIRRSLRRMISVDQAAALDRRLLVWKGPLPFQLNRDPSALADFIADIEARHHTVIREVILDSLKDVATELAKDEGGSAVAQAINHLVAVGQEVLVLHHERKAERGAKKAPGDIGDVYGSQFLTACAGNVLYLHGEPGGHVLSLHHLKQSADVVGPLDLEYDHDTGALTVLPQKDLLRLLQGARRGLTVHTACLLLYGADSPDRNMVARVYRRLEQLTAKGLAWREKPEGGFDKAAIYYPGTPAEAA